MELHQKPKKTQPENNQPSSISATENNQEQEQDQKPEDLQSGFKLRSIKDILIPY